MEAITLSPWLNWLVSTYVVCERLSVMHEPAGVVEIFYRIPLFWNTVSEYPPQKNWNLGRSWHFVTFKFQNTPPPPENWNLGRSWHFVTFQFQNTPPPKKLKFRQILALCHFSVSEYPPTQKLELRQILALCHFSVSEYPPPQKLKFRQILALCHFWVSEYPPPLKIEI